MSESARVEHETGSWLWSFGCSQSENQYLHVALNTFNGERTIDFNDGGDSIYLDEPTSAVLIEAVRDMRRLAGWST